VVDDQIGRLTFTGELSKGTQHLLHAKAAYGTYNLTNEGKPTSWADLARAVFRLTGRSPDDVTGVSTEAYAAGRPIAPRPRHSMLDLSKIQESGFEPEDAMSALERYLARS
jgi:dTDP-4-dehydrorhamnose reductase